MLQDVAGFRDTAPTSGVPAWLLLLIQVERRTRDSPKSHTWMRWQLLLCQLLWGRNADMKEQAPELPSGFELQVRLQRAACSV